VQAQSCKLLQRWNSEWCHQQQTFYPVECSFKRLVWGKVFQRNCQTRSSTSNWFFVYGYAKLRMLQLYYDFLDNYLDRKSFALMEMDADSCYFACATSSLEEAVKNEKHTHFYNNLHRSRTALFYLYLNRRIAITPSHLWMIFASFAKKYCIVINGQNKLISDSLSSRTSLYYLKRRVAIAPLRLRMISPFAKCILNN